MLTPLTFLCLWYRLFNFSSGDLHLYGKSESVQSVLRNCESGLWQKPHFSSSFDFFFFFSNLRHSPCGRVISPSAAIAAAATTTALSCCKWANERRAPAACGPELCRSSTWWRQRKGWPRGKASGLAQSRESIGSGCPSPGQNWP